MAAFPHVNNSFWVERRLDKLAAGRDNNYNLVRFVAALMVLVSHSFSLCLGLGGKEPLEGLVGMTLGNVAVDVFFFTSGFLVTGSLIKRKSVGDFVAARAMRVMPALIVCVAFCVFVIGLMFTTWTPSAFLLSEETRQFVLKNIFLLRGAEFDLPGVFASVPCPGVVNGSLWTLPQEVRLYLFLAFLGFVAFRLSARIRWLRLEFTLSVFAVGLFVANVTNHFANFFQREPLQVGFMFFLGAAVYAWRGRVFLSLPLLGGASLLLLLSAFSRDAFFCAYQLFLPVIVLGLAYLPGGGIRLFNRLGDYSYGTYLYAFPVQQSVVALTGIRTPWVMGSISFAVTIVLAVLSWHLLERRWLKRESRQRADSIPSS